MYHFRRTAGLLVARPPQVQSYFLEESCRRRSIGNAVSRPWSTDGRLFIPCTSRLPNGWQLKRSEPVLSALPTFLESEPMSSRNRYISESAGKANWRFGRHSPTHFSSARR